MFSEIYNWSANIEPSFTKTNSLFAYTLIFSFLWLVVIYNQKKCNIFVTFVLKEMTCCSDKVPVLTAYSWMVFSSKRQFLVKRHELKWIYKKNIYICGLILDQYVVNHWNSISCKYPKLLNCFKVSLFKIRSEWLFHALLEPLGFFRNWNDTVN